MSRSAPNSEEIINPNKNWFQWDGGDGLGFKKYDKVEKKNIITKLPFTFLVLDKLTTVTGFNEPENIGYYSNEVRSLKDKITVRSKNGVEAEGNWEEIKAKLASKGANFCQSVYIAYYEGKDLVLGNIKMQGAALENWFKFCKENNVMEIAVQVKTTTKAKKGKVEYFMPVFKSIKIKEETNTAAIEIDKVLQEYLTAYLLKNKTSVEEPKVEAKIEDTKSAEKTETKSEPAKTTETSSFEDMGAGTTDDDDDNDMPF